MGAPSPSKDTDNLLGSPSRPDSIGKAASFQNQVCNAILITVTVLAVPALAASLTRMSEIGWSSIMSMQCLALAVLVTVSLFRNRISYGLRVAVLLMVMLGLGLLGLWNYGHLGGGKLLLLVTVLLTAMFAGIRWAYVTLALCASCLLLYGWLYSNEYISSKADILTYQSSFETWLTAALTLVMLGGFISTGLSRILSYQRELLGSLEKEVSYTQALIQSTVTGLIVFDKGLQLESWNQHASPLFKTSTGRKENKSFTHLLLPNIGDVNLDSQLERALDGIASNNLEIGLRTPDGKIRYYVMSISPRMDHNKTVTGVICVTQDVTELKHSQHTLIHNAKLATLGEMTTSIAHEINQPLTALRLQLTNLLSKAERERKSTDVTDIGQLEKTLKKMDAQIERAARITNHMRVVGHTHDHSNERFSIGELIQDTTLLFAEEFNRLGLHLEVNICDRSLEVLGDATQLEQALLQLLQNAKDAVLEDTNTHSKHVQIHLDAADGNVVIKVIDNGVGIPAEILDQIFEPFFTTKEIGRGTGLGLSTCHSIVTSIGGSISVSAESKGTCFSIMLPLAQ